MKNQYEIRGDITAVFAKNYRLGRIVEFIIDTKDLELVASYPYTWSINHFGYVVGRLKNTNVFLHKFIIPVKGPVDHVNRNPLDNRRKNLTSVTNYENAQNHGLRSDSSSGYRGVIWSKQNKKWLAYLRYQGKNVYFGHFEDVEEAAKAAERGRREYFPYLKKIANQDGGNGGFVM